MSRDVVTLCHQILLLQPALVCQVQTVTSQGDFLFGQIVPVTVALSTEDVPESSRICTTFGELLSCMLSPVYMASVETGHRNVTEVVVVLTVRPATPLTSLAGLIAGGTGGDHVEMSHGQQPGDRH